ncbi:MAG: hypothetical protein A2X97_15525 [Bdellovibrionales bacterium GWA1_52_35]|nr:MAG: hypothetical protein A2X97_15525 [Bdellovibrionales bacterium GWA1_52_35]
MIQPMATQGARIPVTVAALVGTLVAITAVVLITQIPAAAMSVRAITATAWVIPDPAIRAMIQPMATQVARIPITVATAAAITATV